MPGTTSTALSSFSHDSTTKQMRPNGKGGNYWQLNQSNQHSSTYSSIKQQKKNPYYGTIHNEYAREKPRINRQNRQKITFPGSAYPKEISQQCTPATHTEAMHCQGGPLGGLPSLSLITECLWIHLGGGLPNLISPLMPVPHIYR